MRNARVLDLGRHRHPLIAVRHGVEIVRILGHDRLRTCTARRSYACVSGTQVRGDDLEITSPGSARRDLPLGHGLTLPARLTYGGRGRNEAGASACPHPCRCEACSRPPR